MQWHHLSYGHAVNSLFLIIRDNLDFKVTPENRYFTHKTWIRNYFQIMRGLIVAGERTTDQYERRQLP